MQKYPINLQEAKQIDPFAYKNYNDFFIRKLKSTARIIDPALTTIISPCDGFITQYGNTIHNLLVQAKEQKLSIANLLVDPMINTMFKHGKFINIYLAPHNYHRVHMPITGILKKMIYIPGKLFSVNPKVVAKMPNIFTINERVINIFDTEVGKIAIILIGAMIVGSIVTTWHGEVTAGTSKTMQTWNYDNLNLSVKRGEEMGLFQFGSTVIVLFEDHNLKFATDFIPNQVIKMGDRILTVANQ